MTALDSRMISIDNGLSYHTAEGLGEEVLARHAEALAVAAADEAREAAHSAVAPCSQMEFWSEYLRRADDDLVIG